jgi:hypothetical protein
VGVGGWVLPVDLAQVGDLGTDVMTMMTGQLRKLRWHETSVEEDPLAKRKII